MEPTSVAMELCQLAGLQSYISIRVQVVFNMFFSFFEQCLRYITIPF